MMLLTTTTPISLWLDTLYDFDRLTLIGIGRFGACFHSVPSEEKNIQIIKVIEEGNTNPL